MKIGDILPIFELNNQDNENICSQTFLGRPLVIYFYPCDNTPLCTAQACAFRDAYTDFKDLDATVIGISNNTVQSHAGFSDRFSLNFMLLSDIGDRIRNLFNVPKSFFGLTSGRVTYVFNSKGELIYSYNAYLKSNEHTRIALSKLRMNALFD